MARQSKSMIYRNYSARSGQAPASRSKRSPKKFLGILLLVVIVAGAVYGGIHWHNTHNVKAVAVVSSTANKSTTSGSSAASVAPAPNECANNTLGQLALVSISKRHMWACSGTTVAYDSAVITGMENLPADLTPTGTYHIYGKITDTTLAGHDSTGSWSDPVSYWMPFLHNQYGSYGFHDATWRAPTDFGNISPYSTKASHGCVELPLATAKWLYNWAQIGTTVTIES